MVPMRWLALGLLVGVVIAYLFVVPGSTNRRLLDAGLFRTTGRAWRGRYHRLAAALLAWPYMVLRLLGLGRKPAAGLDFESAFVMGPATLRRYRGGGGARPVLLVHSFVSKPSILDLAPGRSLVGALNQAGHDVYLLDWVRPGRDQARTGFEGYVATVRLAVEAVAGRSASGRVPVVGYCMGAALALAADADQPGPVESIVALAPPGDLAVPGGLHRMMRRAAFRPAWLLDGDGLVPGPVIRESFHALRPDQIRSGWRAWRAGRKAPEYRGLADARARWAYDQPPIPGALLFDLTDMVRHNTLLDRLGGSTAPLLVASAERDHIVPPDSSAALADRLGGQLLRVPAGHVAMLTGHDAAERLYPAITQWLAQPRKMRSTVSP